MEWWRGENRLENGKERKDEERQKGKRVSLPRSEAGALSNQIITVSAGGTITYRPSRIATHCCTAASAFSRNTASLLLLIG